MTTLTQKESHTSENYLGYWAVIAIATLGVMAYFTQAGRTPVRPAPLPTAVKTESVDWFLVLQMPAVTTQYESGIDTMRGRYGDWLDGMRQAGFHPMRLSEVYYRLKEGQGVPAKTVVLVFEPGLRRTYSIVAPILESHDWPAVWITPETEMNRGHREYLTYHKTEHMIDSGWWDVGYMSKRGHFVLKTKGLRTIDIGNEEVPAWSRTAGGLALNRGPVFGAMNQLHVSSDWTPTDLVNRLRAEVPVSQPVYLTLAPVQNQDWGITTLVESTEEKHFDLQTPLWRRGIRYAWFGTQSYANYDMEAEAQDLVGHLAFRLRWNEADDTGLILTASRRGWALQQQTTAGAVLLKRFYHGGERGFKATFQLKDNTLVFTEAGQTPSAVLLPPGTPTHGGPLQIYLYDALKGSARVNALRVLFTPQP